MARREGIAGTLVLGATGFLGPHVLERAATRLAGTVWAGGRDPATSVPALTRAAAEPAKADLTSTDEVEAMLERLRPARVLNLAAIASGAACEADPDLAQRINADAPAQVAAWCAGAGARMVHVGTDLVFGAKAPPASGFDEDAPTGPIGVYGETKAAGERAVLAADPAALVVRLPLLYGDSRGRGLGASDGLLAALARGPFTLFEDEWRTPLEAGAAAAALVELAEGDAGGILHVAGPERVSRAELGRAVLASAGSVARGLGAPVYGTRASVGASERAADTSLDTRRARALLATALPGIREGIARWATDRGFDAD